MKYRLQIIRTARWEKRGIGRPMTRWERTVPADYYWSRYRVVDDDYTFFVY